MQLTFTTPPKNLRVLHLGKEVWADGAPTSEMERKLSLAFPKEGIDLQFNVEFPDTAPLAAMRVTLVDPDGNESVKSLWGTGVIDEVQTFP